MITTGVAGRTWRATVTPWGAIEPWDGSARLDWFVAADDRWHVPEREPTVRQRRVDGTAVAETRVRVPTGDVVQRIGSVADGPGYTVVEVENDSSLPVAVAFGRRDLRTERPIGELGGAAGTGRGGPDLPADAFVLPIGHRATARVALAHDGSGAGRLPPLPPLAQVVRGWTAVVERASRFDLPPGDLGSAAALAVSGQRCELALGEMAHAADDAAAFAVGLGELVRMGERADPWLPELVGAVEALGRADGWIVDAALDAAARVLRAAGEQRAAADLARIVARRGERASRPAAPPDGVAFVPWLEQLLADGGELLPQGIPAAWRGANFEVHGVPLGAASTVSYAVRWHGERPAVLWEVSGDPVELTAPAVDPGWRSADLRGDALWTVRDDLVRSP